MTIKEIKARHEAVTDEKGTAAHWDRAWLLEEVERLRSDLSYAVQRYWLAGRWTPEMEKLHDRNFSSMEERQ